MEFKAGQLIVILSPFTEIEVYANIRHVAESTLTLTVKTAGLLKEDWDILCIVMDDTVVYEFYSKVNFLESTNVVIQKPVSSGMSEIEKRRFNRVDYEIGFVARLMQINNISVAKAGKTFVGKTKNLSAGGILAATNLKLPVSTVFNFKLKVNYFIECTAEVKRVNENPEEENYLMGCEFVDMSLEEIKAISLFTFKEQLRIRQKELYESIFK